jgi:hydroxyacyl-ACP dehydratase HTD2-like protein with hotdog domain
MASLLRDETLAAIGRHRPLRHGLVTATDIRRYCVAIDNRNPLYLDADAARAAGHERVIAPPLFAHAPLRPSPFQSDLLPDGQLPDLAPPGLEHLQSLLAGQDWEFHRPVLEGERLVEDTWYGPIEEREGRSGPMVFVTEESLISDDAGAPVLRSRNRLIFRPAPQGQAGPAAAHAPAPETGAPATQFRDGRLIKRPSMVALFMFDAVIWATHRLHWDAAQAQREGLAGPVLPGWMAASYLSDLCERLAPSGKRLASLDLKYKSFAYPGDELISTATAEGDVLSLTMANQHGVEIQAGSASFA